MFCIYSPPCGGSERNVESSFQGSVENLSRVCSNNASPGVRLISGFLLFPCFLRFQLHPVLWEFLSGVQSRGTRRRQQYHCEFSDRCSPGNSPVCGPGSREPSFLYEALRRGRTLAGRDDHIPHNRDHISLNMLSDSRVFAVCLLL